ncbi:hypothetical protein GCM10027082_12470 [Comamonas humi]
MEEINAHEPVSRQYQRQRRRGGMGKAVALLVLVLAAGGYGWWKYGRQMVAPAPQAETPAQPAPEAASPPSAADKAASEAEEHHPLEPAADAQGNPPLAPDANTAFDSAVTGWLGRERSLRFVAADGLARRIVATIDNLPRSHVASQLWPLHPVGGRMAVEGSGADLHIAAGNAARYGAVVDFVTGLDPAPGVALYKRVYPVLQRTYEELGYPGKHFNDRLVAVIDHLLKTPEPVQPLALKLVQVQGQVAPQQPWLRYEFADPQLQALSSGQKILLRMGPEHASRVKASLRAVRAQITK